MDRARVAAERGDPVSQWYLGVLLETGNGVEADGEEALQWYILAGDAGLQRATKRRLALIRRLSRHAVWRAEQRAAELGDLGWAHECPSGQEYRANTDSCIRPPHCVVAPHPKYPSKARRSQPAALRVAYPCVNPPKPSAALTRGIKMKRLVIAATVLLAGSLLTSGCASQTQAEAQVERVSDQLAQGKARFGACLDRSKATGVWADVEEFLITRASDPRKIEKMATNRNANKEEKAALLKARATTQL